MLSEDQKRDIVRRELKRIIGDYMGNTVTPRFLDVQMDYEDGIDPNLDDITLSEFRSIYGKDGTKSFIITRKFTNMYGEDVTLESLEETFPTIVKEMTDYADYLREEYTRRIKSCQDAETARQHIERYKNESETTRYDPGRDVAYIEFQEVHDKEKEFTPPKGSRK